MRCKCISICYQTIWQYYGQIIYHKGTENLALCVGDANCIFPVFYEPIKRDTISKYLLAIHYEEKANKPQKSSNQARNSLSRRNLRFIIGYTILLNSIMVGE